MRVRAFQFIVSPMVALLVASPALADEQTRANERTSDSKVSGQNNSGVKAEKNKESQIDKLTRELAIMIGKRPVETLETVKLRIKLANAFANNQQYKDAAGQLEMVREYFKLTGKGSFDERLIVLGRLVDNYNFMGNGKKSLYLANQYFDRVEDLSQATHTDKLAGYWRLAYAYNLNKNYEQAQKMIKAGREMVKVHFNSRSPMDSLLLQEQLKINLSQKEKKKAKRTESDIMKSIDSTVSKNSNLGVFMMFQLAKVYSKYGDLDSAKRVLVNALSQPVIKKGDFESLKCNLEKELEKISN